MTTPTPLVQDQNLSHVGANAHGHAHNHTHVTTNEPLAHDPSWTNASISEAPMQGSLPLIFYSQPASAIPEASQPSQVTTDIAAASQDATLATPTSPELAVPALIEPESASKPALTSSPLSDPGTVLSIDYDYDGPQGHRVLRLKPTSEQWADFPALLAFARRHGSDEDGCFKLLLPQERRLALPEKEAQKVRANAYKPSQSKKNSIWRVESVPSEGTFDSQNSGPEYNDTALEAFNRLRKMFSKSNRKQLRSIRYRVDVPAWTPEQRRQAGVPDQSPIYPLKGDKLDNTKAIIPGIHTPYVYESGPFFGASFQIHAEDFRLVSLNHLYKGRKIWIVVPSTAVDIAEEALGRKGKCSQFMRHRAEFFFPQKLEKMGVPFRVVDQQAGETIVILPDAYHEGFSTGYTIAEAKNYADSSWTTETYQPCEVKCQLSTAIPAEMMMLVKDGEERIDLCRNFDINALVVNEDDESSEDNDDEETKKPQPTPKAKPKTKAKATKGANVANKPKAKAPAKRGLPVSERATRGNNKRVKR